METKIREQILRWLTRRDHSKQEIIQKLKVKKLPLDIAEPIIDSFIEADLINENRYTQNYLSMRRRKGFGPIRINMELKGKGIQDEIIAQHLNINDNAWLTDVKTVWQKRFKGIVTEDFSKLSKQKRFLQLRGFTQEQINHVTKTPDEIDY